MDYLFDDAKWFTAILVPEVVLEIFVRERASKPRSGDIAGNELRSGEKREGFFLSPHSFGTAICSFPGIGASNTNFHFVNQLVRYVPIFIILHECTAAVNRLAGSLRRR